MENENEEYISESLLLRFFSGETSMLENEEIISRIKSSEACARKAKEVYSIYYASVWKRTQQTVDVDEAFRSVEKKLQEKGSRLNRTKVIRLFQRVAVAIALPLCVLTGYLLNEKSASEPIHQVEVSAKMGMVAKAILPDSTIVWLNSGSTLSYPSRFLSGERNVQLEGEAYFEVRKAEDNPFLINKGKDLSIRVLGTSFNVEAYAADGQITTTLVEGSVKVLHRDKRGESAETYLTPSQKLVYDKQTKLVEKQDVSVAQYIAWKEGRIILEDTGMKEVLHMLSKHFNVDFEVKNEAVYSNAFTGKFEGERLEEILTMISMTSKVRYAHKHRDSLTEKRVVEIY